MPSIPQSLLWISLVVLWLFVLVPMLIGKRDAVRRTSDVALATRVLNSGRAARLLRRSRPAAGHRTDPDWRPPAEDIDDDLDEEPTERSGAVSRSAAVGRSVAGRSVVVAAADLSDIGPDSDYLDVDVVDEDSGALPVGSTGSVAHSEVTEEASAEEPVGDPPGEDGLGEVEREELHDETDELPLDFGESAADELLEPDRERGAAADEYEYVDDSSGLEAPSETDLQLADSLTAARRRRRESSTAAAVSARKYKFRKRMLTVMAMLVAVTGAAALTVASVLWWVCGTIGVVTVLYLGYLRRQTRIEERLRRRRAQRIARSRLGVENAHDPEYDVVPSRLRRPGSVVLEIDDEDPAFEHLDDVTFARGFDLPHAAGQ